MSLIRYLLLALAFSGAAHATDFTISVTDTNQLAGIAAARAQYNAVCAARPQGQCSSINTDAAFMAQIMQNQVTTWQRQNAVKMLDAARTVCLQTGDCAGAAAASAAVPQ